MNERIVVRPQLDDTKLLELAMTYICQFMHRGKAIRLLIQASNEARQTIGYKEASEYYERALAIIKENNSAVTEEMKAIYLRSLADLKHRCMMAENLDAEIKVTRDIGVVLGILKPTAVKVEETPADKATETRIKEKIKEWAKKHQDE